MVSSFGAAAVLPPAVLRQLPRVIAWWLLSSVTILVSSSDATSDVDIRSVGDPIVNTSVDGFDYGVVIDAGSTGSRIHIFQWPKRIIRLKTAGKMVGTPLSVPVSVGAMHVTPSLSSFIDASVDTDEKVRNSLGPLLTYAEGVLLNITPPVDLKAVPIYLSATGGLRVHPNEKIHAIIEAARRLLGSTPFAQTRYGVRVLSGEEEGAFGWLSVNANSPAGVASSPDTLGVLDIGGESAQISFVPHGPSIKASFFPMHFGSHEKSPIHLYTHSFLGFGLNIAWQKAGAMLHRDSDQADELAQERSLKIDHPCLPLGVSWHVDEGDYGVSIERVPERESGKIVFRGAHDFDACVALARRLIPKDVPCPFGEECSFLGQYQPAVRGTTFAAIGAFNVMFNEDMKLTEGMTLEQAMLAIHRKFDVMGAPMRGSGPPLPWNAIFAVVLLTDGFGVEFGRSLFWNPARWKGFASWPAGQIIYEANHLSWTVLGPTTGGQTLSLPQSLQTVPSASIAHNGTVEGGFFGFLPITVICTLTVCFLFVLSVQRLRRRSRGDEDEDEDWSSMTTRSASAQSLLNWFTANPDTVSFVG
eukprot:TRINITY_DN946_c1_g1_i1.p1 TRINITY_DN946_c1_g1~~TRINITY_DN946_c1_g1_i1.p1  ORF type:complete len:586 (+),score=68.95 TRINITY_DN946_c1_g1_i1:98-1855(+)